VIRLRSGCDRSLAVRFAASTRVVREHAHAGRLEELARGRSSLRARHRGLHADATQRRHTADEQLDVDAAVLRGLPLRDASADDESGAIGCTGSDERREDASCFSSVSRGTRLTVLALSFFFMIVLFAGADRWGFAACPCTPTLAPAIASSASVTGLSDDINHVVLAGTIAKWRQIHDKQCARHPVIYVKNIISDDSRRAVRR
jgi:hypothetical protein